MVGAVDVVSLREVLDIDDRYKILLVIALGKPGEEIVVDEVADGGDIRYWRDEKGVHHVPKRRLEDVVIGGA